MYVASLELCQELYELSEWDEAHASWIEVPTWNPAFPKPADHVVCGYVCEDEHRRVLAPAYDLGYLLRKLPGSTSVTSHAAMTGKGKKAPYRYSTSNSRLKVDKPDLYWGERRIACGGDTPEDALCSLCIEMFKCGVLIRED